MRDCHRLLQINFQMFFGYTILVRLTFILLTELSQAPIKMLEGSKYVLQIFLVQIALPDAEIISANQSIGTKMKKLQ